MKNNVVLENVMNGLFITSLEYSKFHSPAYNPRVDRSREAEILDVFNSVKLQPLTTTVSKAETPKYIFMQYAEEYDDEIVWVKVKEEVLQTV